MDKPKALRAAIEAALPEFAREPDRLRVWIEDGSGRSTQSATLGFGFSYRLNVLLVEMATDVAIAALAIFRWLRVNQCDLMMPGVDGFSFDADFLDNGTADVLIQLALTENVQVTPREDGGWQLDYLPEPDPMFASETPPDGLDDVVDLTAVITTAHANA